jgi:hypothetical protein
MTKRELQAKNGELHQQHAQLLGLLVAIVRRSPSAGVYITKRELDDQDQDWTLWTEPINNNEAVLIRAIKQPAIRGVQSHADTH